MPEGHINKPKTRCAKVVPANFRFKISTYHRSAYSTRMKCIFTTQFSVKIDQRTFLQRIKHARAWNFSMNLSTRSSRKTFLRMVALKFVCNKNVTVILSVTTRCLLKFVRTHRVATVWELRAPKDKHSAARKM